MTPACPNCLMREGVRIVGYTLDPQEPHASTKYRCDCGHEWYVTREEPEQTDPPSDAA